MNSATPVKKILILAANPKVTSRLRLDEELREIKNGLRRASKREQFLIESAEAVRDRDIHRAIIDFEPQIVHFSGHGVYEKGLVFEDEIGQEKLVDAEALAGLFELFANQVKCVLLNACYSKVQAEAIAQHIDYVIGMNQEIGDRAAIEFTVGFYDALGSGKSIEFAYKLGCNCIRTAGISGVPTPELFTKKPFCTEASKFTHNIPKLKPESTTIVECAKWQDIQAFEKLKQADMSNIEVFLSCCSDDNKLRMELETSFRSLESQGIIRIWHESDIAPGGNKKVEIEQHLNTARIILLLISRNFLLSDYHLNYEVKRAMERREAQGTWVIPVLLSSVYDWQSINFGTLRLGDLQTLPKNGKFVTDRKSWTSKIVAFDTIAREFAEQVKNLSAE